MTTIQIADVLNNIECRLAELSVRQNMLDSYGIKCENETEIVDKLSAYQWVLNSGCSITNSLWCLIKDCTKEPIVFECNPILDCSPLLTRDCKIYPKEMSVIEPINCILPSDTINIIL